MSEQKTHRHIKNPQISSRHLADYMAASETARRTIVRNCKYQPIARIIQHDEAKLIVARFILNGNPDVSLLSAQSQKIRDRLVDSEFDSELQDHNADYVDRFAKVFPDMDFPAADFLAPGNAPSLPLEGVKVSIELQCRLQRVTRTNKVRVGAIMLRYAKGKPLPPEVGAWQSAFLFGYLGAVGLDGAEAERKLCLTIDAYAGVVHPAPTDSTRRFQHMTAACASIAERWPNVAPPANAVF